MIELVISVCLISEPQRCKDVALVSVEEGMSSMQCMMQAPPTIASWIDGHPKWVLKRWACQKAGRYADL